LGEHIVHKIIKDDGVLESCKSSHF
jgi:hypothetical protein